MQRATHIHRDFGYVKQLAPWRLARSWYSGIKGYVAKAKVIEPGIYYGAKIHVDQRLCDEIQGPEDLRDRCEWYCSCSRCEVPMVQDHEVEDVYYCQVCGEAKLI